MAEQEQATTENQAQHTAGPTAHDYEEFEIGEHKVPWFLWVGFTFIVVWASVSWIKFFGY